MKINFLTLLFGFSQIYAWATTYYLPAAIMNIVISETGLNRFALMGGFSWALLLGGLCAPKIGEWIDVEGGCRPLSCGSLFMGLGLVILAQTSGIVIWYLGWTFIGLGMALGLFNATFATVGRLLGQDAKKIIVRITLISGFATLFWPITTSLIQSIGWRETALIFAMPHLLICAPLYYFSIPRSVPEKFEENESSVLVIPSKIKIVFSLLVVYATIRSMVGTAISVNIISMLEGIGLSLSIAAVIAGLIGPSQILGRILEMYFGKKFDPINTSIFWTAVFPAAIFFLVLLGPSFSPIFAVAYGMSNGVLTITMSVLPLVLFGTNGYAKLLGKLALPVFIAQAISPLLIVPLINNWTSIDLFILAGVLGVVSLGCLIFMSQVAKQESILNF